MNILHSIERKIFPSIVGIIYYDPVKHCRFGELICDVRKIHRLDEMTPRPLSTNKRFDGAEIASYWFLIYGKETCIKMIEAFLKDCEMRLKKNGATGVEIKIIFQNEKYL